MVEEGPVDSNPGVDLVGSSRRLEEDRRTKVSLHSYLFFAQ